MPGEPLIPLSRWALFGKLPTHGDFVRRGDPALVRRLDSWLSDEIDGLAAAEGQALDARLDALPTWCFLLPEGLAGVLAASSDRVGRVFPVVACVAGSRAAAESVAGAIVQGRDARDTATQIGDNIALLADAAPAQPNLGDADLEQAAADAATWWRPFETGCAARTGVGLPTDADFARLLER